jgi:hypothetical protein
MKLSEIAQQTRHADPDIGCTESGQHEGILEVGLNGEMLCTKHKLEQALQMGAGKMMINGLVARLEHS